ncbi:3-phosphoshikimate 1-carboxyvinyltransferase [bacterium]|nr:3-phosphoshikimate 1-carboxyvinyltransferase [bacterium]
MTASDLRFIVRPGPSLHGETSVPGDKSLSHRAVLLGMLAAGESRVRGWLAAGDTEASLRAVQSLGVPVHRHDAHRLTLQGGTLQAPGEALDLVNAGTGIRLLAGIMAGQPFTTMLDGSSQLRRRPMKRIVAPLTEMGARIDSADGFAPLICHPAALRGIHYAMPVASAQVKSAVLLAGLFAEGPTTVTQPGPARDHTERMLRSMGAALDVDGDTVVLTPGSPLKPLDMTVPGDISSAAFLIVAGLVVPGSEIVLRGVNLNLRARAVLDVLQAMGAELVISETGEEAGEPVGTIRVKHGTLRGVEIGGEVVVRMIDEFPVLMVAALCAEGETLVRDALELRVKETDRIAVMSAELRKLGAVIEEREDGFRIVGPQKLTGATVDGHDDHRVAMSLTVAGLVASDETVVLDARCAGDSFPGFRETVAGLGGDVSETM